MVKIPSFFTTNALQVISNAADGVPARLSAPVATGFNNSIFSSQSDICVQLGIYGVYDGHSVLVAQCTVLSAQCTVLGAQCARWSGFLSSNEHKPQH